MPIKHFLTKLRCNKIRAPPETLTCPILPQESDVKYRAAAMFTLHQINAFEENGFLVMDMCCGDNGEVIADFTLENLRRTSGEEIDKVNTRTH